MGKRYLVYPYYVVADHAVSALSTSTADTTGCMRFIELTNVLTARCAVPWCAARYLRHFRGIFSSRTLQGLFPAIGFFTGMAVMAGKNVGGGGKQA
jgi:hypothetical protein